MKIKELNKELQLKSAAQLGKQSAELREQVRDLRFKVSQNQFKEVRKLRELKKTLSRVMTIIAQKSKFAVGETKEEK